MAVPYIRSLQRQGVIADVKHFAVNNQEGRRVGSETIGSRYTVDAEVGERTLREIYLPAFEAAVKDAGVGSVMCSYNRLNGPHACASRPLLNGILRRDWGFKGLVLADYGASKTVAGGLAAGLDYEPWPFVDSDGGENFTPAVIALALEAGEIDRGDIDRAVRHILRTLFASGFFDRAAYVPDEPAIDKTAHRRTSRRLAERGAVLLRNRGGALPLDRPAARLARGDRRRLGALRERRRLLEHRPVQLHERPRRGDGPRRRRRGRGELRRRHRSRREPPTSPTAPTPPWSWSPTPPSEGADKPCLGLDCGAGPIGGVELDRDALIEAVAAANPRTIVVLETAGPVLTPWRGDVDAILEAWYPGMAAGSAVARLLFGDVDPSGRLPATFPRREADLPTAGRPHRYPGVDGVADYSEGVLVGYRWYDRKRIEPAYPFGFGLSYTRFALDGLRVRGDRSGRRSRLAPGQKSRRSRRHGRAADLRPPAGRAGPDPAAAAAQGLRQCRPASGRREARRLPASTAATSHTGTALATAGGSPPAATGSSSAAPRATSSTTSRSRCTAEAAGAADPPATRPLPRAALPFRPAPRRPWRGGRAVECGGLENRCASIRRTEGSNPSPSAVEPGMAWISELLASPRRCALGSPANRRDGEPHRHASTQRGAALRPRWAIGLGSGRSRDRVEAT